MRIVYDTNFLMSIIKFRIDLFKELDLILDKPYENIIFDSVVTELRNLAKGKTKSSDEARICLTFIKTKFHVIKALEGKVDDVIFSMSDEDSAVATNDIELRKRLKSKGIKTIYLRAKKHLAIS
ncbi:MAG: DNA-binding protein [Candidatus Aenigmatarchaeota archaeon]